MIYEVEEIKLSVRNPRITKKMFLNKEFKGNFPMENIKGTTINPFLKTSCFILINLK